jgi:hypothetical protein
MDVPFVLFITSKVTKFSLPLSFKQSDAKKNNYKQLDYS